MISSISNIVDNLALGIHKIKHKYGRDNKKHKACGTKYKHLVCCIEYI